MPVMRILCWIACALLLSGFDLQGHRGARGLAPENTLPAFARALSLGVTTLEMDAAITKDDVVVVSHDPALNPFITRGPDGKFLEKRGPVIKDTTYAELQRYDVGRIQPQTPYYRDFSDQVPIDGTRIPKLSEVFDLVKRSGNTTVQFDIETKVFPLAPDDTLPPDVFARRLIKEIRAAGMERRTMIQSFDWRTLQLIQKEAPEIRTVYLTVRGRLDNICSGSGQGNRTTPPADCGPSAWTAGFQLKEHGSVARMVKAAGGHIWSPNFNDLDKPQRDEARALGLVVIPWTINDSAVISRIMDLDVDGIISDRPDRVREEMKKRGMQLPKAVPEGATPAPTYEVTPNK